MQHLLKQKTIMFIALICIIILSLILGGIGVAFAEERAENELNIIHISDLHYYPTYMCYKQTESDYSTSQMVNKSKLESKLVTESSAVLKKLFEEIQNKNPNYLLVTGDLSSDGERVALIDIANALRDLQNKVRANGNSNFQILVIAGNHDISNENATDYSTHKGEKIANVTRNEFAKIFAGLGYPNMSDAEAKDFYSEDILDNRYLEYLPYDTTNGRYVPSTNTSNLKFEYMQMDLEEELTEGDLTYIAKDSKGNTFIAMDGVVAGQVGGKIQKSVFEWIKSKASFLGKNIMSLTHQNLVPHFTMQEQWTPDYLYENWEEVRDFLIEKGVKYNFSGHMHANDIASYCDYDGYNLYDLEIGSPIGYGANYRELKIDFYQDGSSNLWQTTRTLTNIDVSLLVRDGYLTKTESTKYSTAIRSDDIIVDLAKYIDERLYDTMLDNVLDTAILYINRDNIVDKIMEFMQNKVADSSVFSKFFKDNMPIIRIIFENLYDNIQNINLQSYEYTGDKVFLKEGENKLRAFVYEFASQMIDINVIKGKNYTIQNMFVDAYTTFLKGGEDPELASSDLKSGLDWLQTGDFVYQVVDMAKDKNNGLITLIKSVLTTNYDLSNRLEEYDTGQIKTMLSVYGQSLKNFNLDSFIKNLLGDKIENKPSGLIDNKLSFLLTDSIAESVCTKISDVLLSFVTDSTYDGSIDVESKVVYAQGDKYTHFAEGKQRGATINDGRLPSMLTMSFGKNVYTDRELVWFTDKRVTGTYIQICEGDRWAFTKPDADVKVIKSDSPNATEIYAVDYPLIDLGILTTYTTKEIARHSLSLTGLKPNTTYSYKVGDVDRGYLSGIYTFKTGNAKKKAPFEMLIVTDLQGMTESGYSTSKKMLSRAKDVSVNGYDFILNLGDFVDDGRNINQWKYALDSSRDVYASLPQVISAGNHDNKIFAPSEGYIPSSMNVNASNYSALDLHFNNVQAKDNKNYYSFDYSGVHFVVLDTNDITENDNLSFEQIEWLIEDLKKNVDNPVVVAMHKGIYSAGPHRNDPEIVNMRKVLSKIFNEYKVELVLQGHDHVYSESFFLDSEGKKTKTPVYRQGNNINNNDSGVLYVTMGSGGNKFYEFDKNTDDFINKGKMFHFPKLNNPTFGRLQFDGNNIQFFSYEYDLAKDKIEQLKMFSDYSVTVIVSIITALLILVVMIVLVIWLLKSHKKKIEQCKNDNF